MTDTRIHPVTGETLTRQVRKETVRFGSQSEEIEVAGWYPEGDGDALYTGEDLKEWDATLIRMRNDQKEG